MSGLLIHYRDAYFEESRQVIDSGSAASGQPRGLVGRQVANAEMLQALLRHGSDLALTFLVQGDRDAASLKRLLQRDLPSHKKAVIKRFETLSRWFPQLGPCVLWQPQPPSAMFAWLRQRYQADLVAIGGITHALCSAVAIQTMKELVAAPTCGVDRLVCTSEAVAQTARSLIDHASRWSGRAMDADQLVLETIPLGVDCQRHRPAEPNQRRDVRMQLGIDEETVAFLFVGRLSHHAKSNPMPLFAACQRASQRSGQKIALVLAGWYANDAVRRAFEGEAKRLAPTVQLVQVNGMEAQWRESVWDAADVFVSLADSVQETFGLTVVEAMSRRLPVIATDWDGYRETIQHGRTGWLIPTSIVQGAGERSLQSLHEGHLSYDLFLASAGQAVRVDFDAVSEAIYQMAASPEQRQRFGQAGHDFAHRTFDWPHVIARYEALWDRQRSLLRRRVARIAPPSSSAMTRGPAATRPRTVVPSFRELFACYPSRWVDPSERFQAGKGAFGNLTTVLQSPLANHVPQWRADLHATDDLIKQLLSDGETLGANPLSLDDPAMIDTLAWALKYDLIQPDRPISVLSPVAARVRASESMQLTLITTCMGRLEHLKQSLPRLVAQEGCQVVVVDYSCPQRTEQWVHQEFGDRGVTVVSVANRPKYDRSEARNRGWLAACTPWLAFVDADMLLSEDFVTEVNARLRHGRFLRCAMTSGAMGRGGLIVAARETLETFGGYDPVYRGWGEEDEDLVDALVFTGQAFFELPDSVARHMDHDDQLRMKHHDAESFRQRWLINRTYRLAKWDLAQVMGRIPSIEERSPIYDLIEQSITSTDDPVIELKINCRAGNSRKFGVKFDQGFYYRIER